MKKLVFSLLLTVLFSAAFGWGQTGHRVTGHIADAYLSKKTKTALAKILGTESLAMASTWMDEIRSDSTYDYTSDWHWVTINNGETYAASAKNPKGDVIMTLERVINELKSKKLSAEKEREYLKMLIHLIGDIHQPLHVGCCDDRGGNQVKVTWHGANSNLHTVWDTKMIESTDLSYTEFAASLAKPSAAEVKRLQSSSILDWANESIALRKQVYNYGDGKLGYEYSYQNLNTVRKRLLEAGVRLAGVLNQIYG
jgi:hypothetical protein